MSRSAAAARALTIAMALTIGLSGCGMFGADRGPDGGSTAPSASPKRITLAIKSDPADLNAPIAEAPGASDIRRLLHNGLTDSDDEGRRYPKLAEAVPTTENGLWKVFPDGRMETTWNIRPNAQWHDGTPVSADDFIFGSTVDQDREIALTGDRAYGFVERVQAPDARTVRVIWRQPYITADALFGNPMPRHLLAQPYTDNKMGFLGLPYWSEQFVGTGPFRLREWARGSHLTLEANDHYFLGRPRIDEVQVKFILDENTLVANVLAGTIDLTVTTRLSLEQAIEVSQQWRDGHMVVYYSGRVLLYPQLLNPSPAVIGDARFRQALLRAIDRQQLVDALMGGQSASAHTFLPPTAPEYPEIEPHIVKYEFDPGRSAQSLEDLGYRKGADGIYQDATGQRLGLQIQAITTPSLLQRSMLSVADMWRQLGIDTEVVTIPPQRQNDWPVRASFPGFELNYRIANKISDTGMADHLRNTSAKTAENNFPAGGNPNPSRLMNPDWDALLDRYLTTIPPRERTQIWGQLINWETRELFVMGLFYFAEATLLSNRLQNAAAAPAGALWRAHEWEVGS